MPDSEGDKDVRGKSLIIAGTKGMPGAAILSATAALRAGTGKLTIGAVRSIAPWVAMAIPEAMVIELAEKSSDGVSTQNLKKTTEKPRGRRCRRHWPGYGR